MGPITIPFPEINWVVFQWMMFAYTIAFILGFLISWFWVMRKILKDNKQMGGGYL